MQLEDGQDGQRKVNCMSNVEIIRQWTSGPLRQISNSRTGSFLPRSDGTFAGQYVCDGCGLPSIGIYGPTEAKTWLCGKCRTAAKPRIAQPAHLRKAR